MSLDFSYLDYKCGFKMFILFLTKFLNRPEGKAKGL